MDGINNKAGIIKNILDLDQYVKISEYFKNNKQLDLIPFDEFGRKLIGEKTDPILKEYSLILLPKVKNFFNIDSLIPSYSLFAEYSDKTISLHKHKDANACTYTIDLVLYQNKPWSLFIDGTEYIANNNDAILFMGEEYEHWRETINDNDDKIGVVFFHYVKPDHWFFIDGPEHVENIRKQMRLNNE